MAYSTKNFECKSTAFNNLLINYLNLYLWKSLSVLQTATVTQDSPLAAALMVMEIASALSVFLDHVAISVVKASMTFLTASVSSMMYCT